MRANTQHHILTAILNFLAPPLSIRRQFLQLAGAVLPTLQQDGPATVVKRTYAVIAGYRRTGSLIIPPPPVPPSVPPYPYAEWIAVHEPTPEMLTTEREAVGQLAYQPLMSILTPVYNPPLETFRARHSLGSATNVSTLAVVPGQWRR